MSTAVNYYHYYVYKLLVVNLSRGRATRPGRKKKTDFGSFAVWRASRRRSCRQVLHEQPQVFISGSRFKRQCHAWMHKGREKLPPQLEKWHGGVRDSAHASEKRNGILDALMDIAFSTGSTESTSASTAFTTDTLAASVD